VRRKKTTPTTRMPRTTQILKIIPCENGYGRRLFLNDHELIDVLDFDVSIGTGKSTTATFTVLLSEVRANENADD